MGPGMSGAPHDAPRHRVGDAAAWDARYAEAAQEHGSVWSLAPNATVEAALADVLPGAAVDLAAGEGRNAIWLATRGWQVTAVDFSAAGLDTGRRRATAADVDVAWVLADVTTWAPPGPVDLVLLAYLQLPEPVLVPLLARAAGWLAPGGRLLVVGHDRDNLEHGVGGPQDPTVLHTADMLRAGASTLVIDRCEQVLRPVQTPEGARRAIDTVLDAHRARPES
jgi:SAM-dependent methyltransferase